ncbi:tetratricopeptide repeat protein [Sphingomonas sp.]|uniref:tetratricopeptide repeat protein n=1 Tax=Sphingomonas sp. TaxID=28214 RepID=UPI0025DF3215|nr:tetratricopeptide repeat protein [Sphingomonas sp.]
MRLSKLQISAAAFGLAIASQAHAQMGGGMAPESTPVQADATVPYRNGVTALQAGDFPTAIKELRKAYDANSIDGNIPYALGMAYALSGQKPEAKKAFQGAVRSQNAPIPAYLQLGLVAIELGDKDLATKQYAALQRKLAKCASKCGDEDRTEIQSAIDELGKKLNP